VFRKKHQDFVMLFLRMAVAHWKLKSGRSRPRLTSTKKQQNRPVHHGGRAGCSWFSIYLLICSKEHEWLIHNIVCVVRCSRPKDAYGLLLSRIQRHAYFFFSWANNK
jgi:hypothetical protein